ncbi:MAG: NADH-quinone oxidoreductase subunit NuoN [Xanthomonadales bacterium]|nr:NADH-quinone oxidoreductase subunit NuoN [Xanthomonadales bacterium]
MTMTWAELSVLLPEMIVATMASVILILDLYIREQRRGLVHFLSLLTLLFAAIATLRLHEEQATIQAVYALEGTFVRDQMGDLLKLFIYLVMAAVFFYAKPYLRARSLFKAEFYVLALFGMLGMMVMISAGNLLSLYLGLELLALSTYALVALDRDNPVAAESAMKYFVLGALASGMLLYGISMIYGLTGSLDLAEIGQAIVGMSGDNLVLAFGLTFIVVGLAFKFGAVPFHMWIPDVYEGSPTAVTVFIAGAPKLAAFAMAIRLLEDGLGGLHGHWQQMIVFLTILSLAIGNIVAIAQTNLKRMLAYSTISHVGFLMLGLLPGTSEGYEAAMFYAIVYALMTVGAFGMIVLLSRAGFEADKLEDFKGLNQRDPWYAFLMLMFMASLAGFPPFIGFFAKVQVLKATLQADMVWLAAVAVIFAIIGAFYYLRVIKLMYMDEPEVDTPIEAPLDLRAAVSANGLAQLGLGLFPGPLIAICAAAF